MAAGAGVDGPPPFLLLRISCIAGRTSLFINGLICFAQVVSSRRRSRNRINNVKDELTTGIEEGPAVELASYIILGVGGIWKYLFSRGVMVSIGMELRFSPRILDASHLFQKKKKKK